MIVRDVMDEVAAAAGTIDGLRTYGWPSGEAVPPFAFCDYPEGGTYDATYGRGMDRFNLPLVVCVARVDERIARELLTSYIDGSGARSVKAAVDGYAYDSADVVRCASFEVMRYQLGGTQYVAVEFTIEIAGQGTTS